MKSILLSIAALCVGTAALAAPLPVLLHPPVVAPSEPTVITPGLEFMGASRISTVEFCATVTGVKDWRNMMTDYEFEAMEDCYNEHT